MEPETQKNTKKNNLLVPISIILGSIIIATSVFFALKSDVGTDVAKKVPGLNQAGKEEAVTRINEKDFPKVNNNDLLKGSTDPKITFVEYSDLDCPFCGRFHSSMKVLLETYPNDIAWVYRHFPLDSLHPDARNKAVIVECIKDTKNPKLAWEIVDSHFDNSQADFKQMVMNITGVSESEYSSCLVNEKYKNIVQEQSDQAIGIGARGTPFSAVILPDNSIYPLAGALPLENILSLVDEILLNS